MLKHGQNVLVDGVPGIIESIYPEGAGQYQGKLHAYIWVRTPSLDFTEMIIDRHCRMKGFKTTENGRAVPFNDIEKRIKVLDIV